MPLLKAKSEERLSKKIRPFCQVTIFALVQAISLIASATPPMSKEIAQAHRRQIETERVNSLDRLIEISDHLSRAELLQSLSRLRISEVKSFITEHLRNPDANLRRAAYFGLTSLSFVNPQEWIPSQLDALHAQAHTDRVAICDALTYSVHPQAGFSVFQIPSRHLALVDQENRDLELEQETLDHCLSAAITIAHSGRSVNISLEIAKRIADLNPLSSSGERSLHFISQMVRAPQLLVSEHRDELLTFFRGVLQEVSRAKELSIKRYSLNALEPEKLLSQVAPWWGVGQLSIGSKDQPFSSHIIHDKHLYHSAQIMGAEESVPLSPLIVQKWLDLVESAFLSFERGGDLSTLERHFNRASMIPYLIVFRTLISQKRLPKALIREARRGLRLLEQIDASLKRNSQKRDLVLEAHLKCHFAAVIDHSVRHLRQLPQCSKDQALLPLIYQLSKSVINHWGSHQQTKALTALYRLQNTVTLAPGFGLEQLTESLVELSPLGRRREWMINRLKEAIDQDSLTSQIAIEAIAEHKLVRLQTEVYDRVVRALEQDEYAVITVGIKCLEVLQVSILSELVPQLIAHDYPELRLLGHALEVRYPQLFAQKISDANDEQNHMRKDQQPRSLQKSPQVAWGKLSAAQHLTIHLSRGSIELKLSPYAFNLIKTLELSIAHHMFEGAVITQKSHDRVTFSAHLDRSWGSWIYPPRSEPSNTLNPLALHDRWVLTWDPLIYDHYRTGWVFSRSADALELIKHGVIAEVISGGDLLETALMGDISIKATLK